MINILFSRLAAGIDVTSTDLHIPRGPLGDATLANGLKLFFGVVAGGTLIVITIGGLKYIFSQGNPTELTKAKDAILYAVIGLVICIFGFGIVKFVFENL